MKRMLTRIAMGTALTLLMTATQAVTSGSTNQTSELILLVGPAEAVRETIAVVLGQKIPLSAANQQLEVGDTVSVFGRFDSGNLVVSHVLKGNRYVPGATRILFSGTVQSMDHSLGRMVVGGQLVDVTPMMSGDAIGECR